MLIASEALGDCERGRELLLQLFSTPLMDHCFQFLVFIFVYASQTLQWHWLVMHSEYWIRSSQDAVTSSRVRWFIFCAIANKYLKICPMMSYVFIRVHLPWLINSFELKISCNHCMDTINNVIRNFFVRKWTKDILVINSVVFVHWREAWHAISGNSIPESSWLFPTAQFREHFYSLLNVKSMSSA